jgi:hypothetical protein
VPSVRTGGFAIKGLRGIALRSLGPGADRRSSSGHPDDDGWSKMMLFHDLGDDGGRDLEVARQAVNWKAPPIQHVSQPERLLDEIDARVTGVLDRPGQQVLVVVQTPGLPGGPVPLTFVGELSSVATADLSRHGEQVDRCSSRGSYLQRGVCSGGRRGSAHSATTSKVCIC